MVKGIIDDCQKREPWCWETNPWTINKILLMIHYSDVVMKDGNIYFKFSLDDACDHNLDCQINHDPDSCSSRYDISSANRGFMNSDELQGLAGGVTAMWETVCETYFGYDPSNGDGIIGVTLLDLKREYDHYRKHIDPTLPSFGSEIDRIFTYNYVQEISKEEINMGKVKEIIGNPEDTFVARELK
jgi:hypothetical protein